MIKNREKRIGAQDGVKEVLKHPWFESIDIAKLIDKKLKPPYKPEI